MIMEDIYYKKDVSTTYDNLCYTYSMDSSRRLSRDLRGDLRCNIINMVLIQKICYRLCSIPFNLI